MINRNCLVKCLGENTFPSNLSGKNFIDENERIIFDSRLSAVTEAFRSSGDMISFELSGPREKLFFNPEKITAGIVTCGGLCPGLNDVIRSVVNCLYYNYGVKKIFGFKYGFRGLTENHYIPPAIILPEDVEDIHEKGGTILGSSRGNQEPSDMIKFMKKYQVNMLFCLGGDGTLRGAHSIAAAAETAGETISIIGIPKTIDNDIGFVERTFGFETAVDEARRTITAAHNEAKGAFNGIGLIKLMGRDSGFIAAHTALSANDSNYVIIPEMDFGPDQLPRFLKHLQKRLENKRHAVIIVAEGAGQKFFPDVKGSDKSGNKSYGDIGIFIKNRINEYFKSINMEMNLKYIDPSYTIRSLPANASDSLLCLMLGQHAVHAAMAGRTDCLIGRDNGFYINVPISFAVRERKKIDLKSDLWASVLNSTGQPEF